VGLKTGFSY